MTDRVVRVRLVGDAKSLIVEANLAAKALHSVAGVKMTDAVRGIHDVEGASDKLKLALVEQAKQGGVTAKSLTVVYDGLEGGGKTATTSVQNMITTLGKLGTTGAQAGKEAGEGIEKGLLSADDAAQAAKVALGGVTEALEDQAAKLLANAKDWASFDKALAGVGSTLDRQTGALTESSRELAAQKIPADFLRSLEQAGVSTKTYLDAMLGAPAALTEMRRALGGNEEALEHLERAQRSVADAQDEFRLRQRAMGEVSEDSARHVNQAAGLIGRAGDASRGAAPLVGRLGDAFDRARTAMVALFAADKFVDFIRESVDAASDFEQSVGAVAAVFGETQDEIEEFASTSATQLGVARGEYQEMASVFGAQLKNMGVSASELVPTTNKLITLGADLAAQFGGTTSEAVEALGSLLRGERDPIERYGVGIKQADINARLAADGMDGLTGAAGKQAELQTTLAILWEQTGSAQGAFSRELDTLATKQQIANAKFEDAKEKIGAKLLPLWAQFTDLIAEDGVPALEAVGRVFGTVLGLLEPLVGLFTDLPGPIQAAALALGAVVVLNAPITRLSATLVGLTGRAAAGSGALLRFGAAGKAALATLGGPLGLAIVGITTALSFMGSESDDTTASVEGLAAAVDDATGKFRDNAKEIAINEVVSSGMAQQYAAMGGSVEDLVLALLGNEDAQKRVNATAAEFEKYARRNEDIDLYQRFTDGYSSGLNTIADAQEKGTLKAELNAGAQKQLAKVQGESGDAAAGSAAKWDDMGDAQKFAADQSKFLTEKLDDVAEAAKAFADSTEAQQALNETESAASDAARAVDIFADAMDKATGRKFTIEEAAADWNDALRNTAQAWTQAAEAGDLNLAALRDWNVAALTATDSGAGLYDAMNQQYEAYKKSTSAAYNAVAETGNLAGAQDAARAAATDARSAFIDMNAEMLGGADKAAALADKLGIVDGTKIDSKTFTLVADDAQAQAALKAAQQAVITNKNFLITADAKAAQAQADTLNATLNAINGKTVRWFAVGNVTIAVTKEQADSANAQAVNHGYKPYDYGFGAAGGRVPELPRRFDAGGRVDRDGRISGPGGPTDDLVVAIGPDGKPVRLSDQEGIVNARGMQRLGPLFDWANAARFADGGRFGAAKAAAGAEFGATLTGQVSAPDPDAVKEPWQQIADVVIDAWDKKIRPALDELDEGSDDVGKHFQDLLVGQAVPSWKGIQEAVTASSQAQGQQQVWLQGVVAAQWAAMAAAQTKSRDDAQTGAYQPWADWSVRLGDAQATLAKATGTQWSGISKSIMDAQKGSITPAFDTINSGSDGVGSKFGDLSASASTRWSEIKGTIDTAKSGTIIPAMDAIKDAAGSLEGAFGLAASGIAAKWSEIKPGVADPVNWLLGSVWNQGLVGAWAKIKGWLPSIGTDLGQLDLVGYAGGGVIPGIDPGRRDNRLVPMRSGEGVLVPEAVGPLGGERGIHRINRLAEQGRLSEVFGPGLATGGVVDSWSGIPSLSSAFDGPDQALPEDMVQFVKSFVANPYDVITDLIGEPLARAKQYDAGLGEAMTGATGEMVGGVISTLKDMFGLENDGKGGPPKLDGSGTVAMDGVLFVDGDAYALPTGTRGAFLKAVASKMGTSYVWGAAGPDVFDCSGLMSWALAQAGAGVGRMTADAFHQGFPHVPLPGKPGDLATYSARYSKASGMAGHIGAILDVGKGLMMHTDGAGPARVSDYRSREGGPLSIVDVIGGAAAAGGSGIGELPAIIARVLYGDFSTAAGLGAIDPKDVTGEVSKWESTRMINTVDPIQDFGAMNMSRGRPEWVGYIPPGDPVYRWAPMVVDIQNRKGKYTPENLANAMSQNSLESSGDALSFNDWDTNWQRGHPSKGLWQTIPGTFRANAQPGFGYNLWHPPSNYWAADNYTDGKYGGRFPLRAYERGGPLPPGFSLAWNGTGKYEHVYTEPPGASIDYKALQAASTAGVQVDYRALADAVGQQGVTPAEIAKAMSGMTFQLENGGNSIRMIARQEATAVAGMQSRINRINGGR